MRTTSARRAIISEPYMWPAPSPLRAPQRTHVRGRRRRRYRPIRRSGHRHRPARFRGPELATRSVDRSAAATVRSGLPDRQLQVAPARIEPARSATAMDAASDGDPMASGVVAVLHVLPRTARSGCRTRDRCHADQGAHRRIAESTIKNLMQIEQGRPVLEQPQTARPRADLRDGDVGCSSAETTGPEGQDDAGVQNPPVV
jgi:hypothetical protein